MENRKTFTEQNKIIHLEKYASMSPTWFDCNNDGKQDIFVPTRFAASLLYINQGNDSFKQIPLNHNSNGNSAIIDDLNNDGHPDILEISLHQRKLLINNGKCDFSKEIIISDNIYNYSWGGITIDTFNEGDKNIYITGGFPINSHYLSLSPKKKSNQLLEALRAANENIFLYKKENTFTNKTREYNLNYVDISRGVAKGDLNNDGKIDFVVNNLNTGVNIYYNKAKTTNNSLNIKLFSQKKNRFNIGAKIEVLANNKWQSDSIAAGESFLSQSSHTLHFGVGKAKIIDKIKITWANGKKSQLKNIPVNNILIIYDN